MDIVGGKREPVESIEKGKELISDVDLVNELSNELDKYDELMDDKLFIFRLINGLNAEFVDSNRLADSLLIELLIELFIILMDMLDDNELFELLIESMRSNSPDDLFCEFCCLLAFVDLVCGVLT